MLLNTTLKANLDVLKIFTPVIYEMFKSYNPVGSGVVIDDEGNIDLYNEKKFIYGGNPADFAKEQVKEFIENPMYYNLKLEEIDERNMLYDHMRVLKGIETKREKEVTTTPIFNENRLDFVCMIGIGLGYQIEELLVQKQVQNLYLCEPSKDIFYAMLHCIELRPIFEHCINNGGEVIINTGNDYANMVDGINQVLRRIGRFYLPRFYIYKHYNSATTDNFIEQLKKIGHSFAFGFGFMEDEIIGFRHTLANLKLGYKVCKKQSEFTNNEPSRPVFIVANGPSLDFSLKFLKENQNNIIIVSCGTTLRALLKHNIKPDIHVEMERPVELLPFIEEVEQQQKDSSIKLKDIQIIAFNTVYPEVLKKFKKPLILTKSNDAGAEFIEYLDVDNIYTRPAHSNPTCPNTATALIVALGFKKIYFIGTDFGYISNKYHHSKDSIYYAENFEGQVKDEVEASMGQDIRHNGNFREFVFSNSIYDCSREQVEKLLSINSDITAYNCADGALIKHAKPTRLEDIELIDNNLTKELFLEKLLVDAFDKKVFTEKQLDKSIKQTLHVLNVTLDQLILIIDTEVNSREELVDLFIRQHNLLRHLSIRNEYKFNYWLIQGTFQYLQTYIMNNCYMYQDLLARNDFMNYCLKEFKKHLIFLRQKIETTL